MGYNHGVMRKNGTLTIWGVLLFYMACLSAWSSQTRALPVRVFDSATGASVAVSIRVMSLETGFIVANSAGERALFELAEGSYALIASATGYVPLSTQVSIREGEPLPAYELHMDPVMVPKQVRSDELQRLHKPNHMVFTGYVTSEETGKPLANVVVSAPAHNVATVSDDSGFFALTVPLRDAKQITQRYVDLLFAKPGYQTQRRERAEMWSGGDWIYKIRLVSGVGSETVDERLLRRRADEGAPPCDDCNHEESDPLPQQPDLLQPVLNPRFSDFGTLSPAPIVMPKSIRVGRNCPTRTTCTTVQVYTLDTYCKGVLPAEWYACWGSVSGGMECLKAGAVAVRSYAVSFVYSPATSNYDICDTTSCQVFTGNQSSNTNTAVDQTTRYVLLTSSGSIARSEYSAENNNAGCGNGFSGTGGSWPCISDPVCTGFTFNGHGRGLCQWGSARWATGRRLSSSQACTSAAPLHGYGTKDWQQILQHYYGPGGYQLVQGATATLQGLVVNPNPVASGATTTLQYQLTATHEYAAILGATIAPAGTTNFISDTPRDLRVNLETGANTPSRGFFVPLGTTPGMYDVAASLWFDRNSNNRIDTGDFVIEDRAFNSLLQVSAVPILQFPTANGRRGQTVNLRAVLRENGTNAPIPNLTVEFKVQGVSVGSAVTNSSGEAILAYTIPLTLNIGFRPMTAEFAGNAQYSAVSSSSTLNVRPVIVEGTVQLANFPNPAGSTMRLVIKRGGNQEEVDIDLDASGQFSEETLLAGNDATVSAAIINGTWLRKRHAVTLSDRVVLLFTLPNGDVDGSGTVDDEDLLLVLFEFGYPPQSADLNGDGSVDDEDLLIVLFAFGLSQDPE